MHGGMQLEACSWGRLQAILAVPACAGMLPCHPQHPHATLIPPPSHSPLSPARRLLQGKAVTVRQYLPYFSSPTSRHPGAEVSFISLEITACGLCDDDDTSGATTPALFL